MLSSVPAPPGCNMIIPHEDTYWNDRDDVTIVSGDPLYTTKVDFMRKNNMVMFRIHDHMHSQRPDFTYVGLRARARPRRKYETAPNSHRFVVPETTLGALAADDEEADRRARASSRRQSRRRKVSRIQLGVGYATPAVNNPEVDVVISGEQQETDGRLDSPEYVLDAVTLGIARAGSCWGTRSPRRPACWRWRSGSRGSSRKCRFNS